MVQAGIVLGFDSDAATVYDTILVACGNAISFYPRLNMLYNTKRRCCFVVNVFLFNMFRKG